ncbi:MAG: ChbG/HpnK family deacetylase [candidate division Zixibacteria bacterium]|nr:ChbG/HpnK family deacetylase [candidate division Zixibacteria bacterium]
MRFESHDDLLKIYSPPPLRGSERAVTLTEMLGFDPGSKVVIVNADDMGICHGTNSAVANLLETGRLDSVSLIAGAREFDHAVELLKRLHKPTGVHFSLTSEWEGDIIRPLMPIDRIPSLLNGEGGLYNEITDLYDSFKLAEVKSECLAQYEKIAETGLEIDHLDTHMGALQLHTDLVELYMDMAYKLKLPVRLGSMALAELMNLPGELLKRALQMGLIFTDNLVYIPMSLTPRKNERLAIYKFMLENLPAGVTELYFHPTYDSDDFRALNHQYSERKNLDYNAVRIWDYQFLVSDDFSRIIEDNDIIRVSYSDLKALL